MAYSKVVIFGDVGAGKSTMIRTLSEIRAVDTDRRSTVDIGKEMTTVGIDYGRIHVDEDLAIGLYGVPGQRRFSALWDQVLRGAWGVILLKKSTEERKVDDIDFLLTHFGDRLTSFPVVVGLTHVDQVNEDTVDSLAEQVGERLVERGLVNTVLSVDCRDARSSMAPLVVLNALRDATAG